jgi:hypothetical protein
MWIELRPGFVVLLWCGRRVGPGSGLTSESADAVSGCLDTALSAGPRLWHPPALPVRSAWPVQRPGFTACRAYDGASVTVRNGAAVAQKVQTLFIDDLDGSAADGMVRFGLDGTEYEIDLNAEHAQ